MRLLWGSNFGGYVCFYCTSSACSWSQQACLYFLIITCDLISFIVNLTALPYHITYSNLSVFGLSYSRNILSTVKTCKKSYGSTHPHFPWAALLPKAYLPTHIITHLSTYSVYRNVCNHLTGWCHCSANYLLASHCKGPGLISGQPMWDFWSTKWHWDTEFLWLLQSSCQMLLH